MRRRNSVNEKLIARRQEYWDSVIESCGTNLARVSDIPRDLGFDEVSKLEMAISAGRMRFYNCECYPEKGAGSQYWENDPSYWWHKKYTLK